MVVDPEMASRQHAYVGGTRGSESNRFYVTYDGEEELSPVDLMATVLDRDAAVMSATEMQRRQEDAAVNLARIGPVWNIAVAEMWAETYRAGVLRVLEQNGLREAIKTDPAAPAFWEAVGGCRAAGIDPVDALASTLTGREVAVTGRSVAQVLHYRLTNQAHMDWEPARCEASNYAQVGTYLDRSPEPDSLTADLAGDSMGRYVRYLAVGMDARVAELGRRVAADLPLWAQKHLGPVPHEGSMTREAWEARAGAVAAYREQYLEDGPADVANPIGRAPSVRRQPGQYAEMGAGRRGDRP